MVSTIKGDNENMKRYDKCIFFVLMSGLLYVNLVIYKPLNEQEILIIGIIPMLSDLNNFKSVHLVQLLNLYLNTRHNFLFG